MTVTVTLSLSLSLSPTMSTNNIGNAVTRFERGPWCVNWAGWPNRLVLYAPEFISLISIKALKESSQYEEFILIHLLLFWIFADLDLIIKQDYESVWYMCSKIKNYYLKIFVKYGWKKYMKMRIILFKNWKWLSENTNQTPLIYSNLIFFLEQTTWLIYFFHI